MVRSCYVVSLHYWAISSSAMNHLMEDLSFSRLRRLRKNKSADEPKVLRQTLLDKQESVRVREVMITIIP